MIASVPSMAFGSPPLTGASRNSTPFASQAAPTFCDTIGLIELMSTTMEPFLAPSSTPFAPRTACSTSGPSGTIVMTISLRLGDVLGRRALRGARGHDFVHAGRHDVVDDQLWPALSRLRPWACP